MVAKERGFRVISEEAVKAATGKSWPYWFRILDRFDVKAKGHTLAAKYLADKHGLGPGGRRPSLFATSGSAA